jgi:hypothetical protein
MGEAEKQLTQLVDKASITVLAPYTSDLIPECATRQRSS